jgi:chitin disaccharide deacetylase
MPLTAPALKGVIVCADDFAVHASASLGIARLAAMARISATSAMVLSPRWAQDVALLQEFRGHIDVGLHLDWTSDFAIDAGHGMSLGAAMRTSVLGGFDRVVARAVVERQLDAFEAHWKAPPDYVDGHQHVQQFAGIRDSLVAVLATRYRPGEAPYLRISKAPAGATDLKSRVIAAMGAQALQRQALDAGLHFSQGLLGAYDFAGDPARYARLMAHWLSVAPQGCILMCHPAQAVEPGDAIGRARVQEFSFLSSPDFSDTLARAHVQLIRGRRDH